MPDKRMKIRCKSWLLAMFEELKFLAGNAPNVTTPVLKTTINFAVRTLVPNIADFIIHDFRSDAQSTRYYTNRTITLIPSA